MPPENARSTRYVTGSAPEQARSRPERWTHAAEREDPDQRYFVYRLCPCDCGNGKVDGEKCPICRGEGRVLDLLKTCPDAAGVGLAFITGGIEGDWDDCPPGLLDTRPEPGQPKWLINPWRMPPSAREVSAAGRVLAKSKQGKGNT